MRPLSTLVALVLGLVGCGSHVKSGLTTLSHGGSPPHGEQGNAIMGRLCTVGYEIGMHTGGSGIGDGNRTGSGASVQSTFKRSGNQALKCDSAIAAGRTAPESAAWIVLDRRYFARAYFWFDNLPSSTIQIMRALGDTTIQGFSARLTSAGKLQLFDNVTGTQIGSDSTATIATGQWYRIEISWVIKSTANIDEIYLRLDGVDVASATDRELGSANDSRPIDVGWLESPGASKVCYVDDLAINDDQGSDQNSWPGEGKVVLLKPISDAQVGSWAGGAGGTSNLWEAVSNAPPIGTASETDSTQIENNDTSPDNSTDEYRANMTTYSDAGIVSGDTITLCQAIVDHGEDISTGTKTGSFLILSNPAQGTADTFTFGDNAGALGTWPSFWRTKRGTAEYNPSVTLDTSPVLRIRKTDTSNRVASVDFAGIYVEYVQAVSAAHRMHLLGVGR